MRRWRQRRPLRQLHGFPSISPDGTHRANTARNGKVPIQSRATMLNRTALVRGLLGCMVLAAGNAHAGFITVDAVPYAGNTRSVAANNEFIGLLSGYGVTNYTLGTSLATDGAGSVEYFYYGKEAGYSNQFQAAGGTLSHTTGFASLQNNFGAPLSLGSTSVGAGLLDFQF